MASGQANPEAMDRMIANMTKFIEVENSVVEALKSNYREVGEEWDDKKYEELGEVIDQAIAAISGNYATISTCITKVQILKSIMEDYLSQNLN